MSYVVGSSRDGFYINGDAEDLSLVRLSLGGLSSAEVLPRSSLVPNIIQQAVTEQDSGVPTDIGNIVSSSAGAIVGRQNYTVLGSDDGGSTIGSDFHGWLSSAGAETVSIAGDDAPSMASSGVLDPLLTSNVLPQQNDESEQQAHADSFPVPGEPSHQSSNPASDSPENITEQPGHEISDPGNNTFMFPGTGATTVHIEDGHMDDALLQSPALVVNDSTDNREITRAHMPTSMAWLTKERKENMMKQMTRYMEAYTEQKEEAFYHKNGYRKHDLPVANFKKRKL